MGALANPNMARQSMAANPNMPQPTARPHVQDMMYRPSTQTMGGNNLGSQLMNTTTGFFDRPAPPTPSTPLAQNPFQQAAAAQTGAMAANRAGMGMVGMGANVLGGALNRTNQGMNETAAGGMSAYQNPYEDQVVQASMRDIGNKGLQMQNTLGAQAQAAGAFGGSRHGIAEAELAKGTQQQMLDQAARLRSQGFNTALGASQADLGRQLGAAGQTAGIGGQVAGMGSALAGLGNNLSGLGQTSFGYGQAINNQQMQQGAMQQGLMQQLINAAKGQYGNYANAPMNKLQLPLAALGAAPVPQTQTTDRQLGIMDYLTAGASFATGMPSFMG